MDFPLWNQLTPLSGSPLWKAAGIPCATRTGWSYFYVVVQPEPEWDDWMGPVLHGWWYLESYGWWFSTQLIQVIWNYTMQDQAVSRPARDWQWRWRSITLTHGRGMAFWGQEWMVWSDQPGVMLNGSLPRWFWHLESWWNSCRIRRNKRAALTEKHKIV